MTQSGILMEMTIDDIRSFKPETVAIGVGSVEPHGPALPYGSDCYQVDRVVRDAVLQANKSGARALMYPILPIGNNVNFKAFPFACRIGVETLMRMLLDIFAALEEDGIRKIVLVNGHGGNTDALRAVMRAHVDATPAQRRAFVCLPNTPLPPGVIKHPSDHGGEAETSRVMHVRGDLVREDKICNAPFGELEIEELKEPGMIFVRPWHAYVPLSAGGDARESSAEKGRQLVEARCDRIAALLIALGQAEWHENFPYRRTD